MPIFTNSWDLRSALQVELDEPRLHAFPVYDGVSLRCGRNSLRVIAGGDYGSSRIVYGQLYFLDVPSAPGGAYPWAGRLQAGAGTVRAGPVGTLGRESPDMAKHDVSVQSAGRHRPAADDARLDVEEGSRLQPVLELATCL